MFDEAYFEQDIKRFYGEVDQEFRKHGCEILGSQDIYFRLSRVATPMIEYSEVKRICADIDGPPLGPNEPSGHRRWPLGWGRAMRRYKKIAESAEASGHHYTAGINFIRASLLAHAGQMFSRPEWPEKLELQKERAACYRRGAKKLGIEAHSVPIGKHALPGYLSLPKGVESPPIVIMAPGANSVKEELHRWAASFVDRGMATFVFDGPGQGELTPLQGSGFPMRLEKYHEAFTAIIDYLEENFSDKVDLQRIAIWGQSMGGHLAIRAFEHEKRPIAAVNIAGPPTDDGYPYSMADHKEEMRDLLGFDTFEETWAYLQEHGDGFDAVKHIDVPFLIIHGSRDDLMGNDVMHRLADEIGDNAELVIYEDGNHGVFNWDFLMTDRIADWLLDKLQVEQPV
jgi:2,6-dihydroxypseudooxynicotine hydrolase